MVLVLVMVLSAVLVLGHKVLVLVLFLHGLLYTAAAFILHRVS